MRWAVAVPECARLGRSKVGIAVIKFLSNALASSGAAAGGTPALRTWQDAGGTLWGAQIHADERALVAGIEQAVG